jgi:hypothetical protein
VRGNPWLRLVAPVVPVALLLLCWTPLGAIEHRLSQPPEGVAPLTPNVPPGVEEEVRRLRKAAQGMRDKADGLRMKAEDLRDRKGQDDQALDLDDRAEDLDYRASAFEDEADQIEHGATRRPLRSRSLP